MADTEPIPPGITPEMLEKFRNLISMDKECNWFHAGEPILHERTLRVLNQSLERNEEGRLIVRIGNAWSYVHYADCPYAVRAIRERGGTPPQKLTLILSDESEEELDPTTLAVGDENVLYCRVKEGREEARFLRPAYYQITPYVEEQNGEFVLRLAEKSYPIGQRVKKQ